MCTPHTLLTTSLCDPPGRVLCHAFTSFLLCLFSALGHLDPLPPPHVLTRLPDLGLLELGGAFCTFGSDFKEMLPIHQNLSFCCSGE